MKLSLFLLTAALLPAQYFPLEAGNQWIYRVDEGPVRELKVAEIVRTETIGEREYAIYRDIQGTLTPIRLTEQNQLVARQPNGSEALWADFEAAEGSSFSTAFDPCTGRGTVESRTETAEILDRAWEGGIRVAYAASSCADAGVTGDLYLPGLGIAERTYQSLTGPRKYRLTYARIGNAAIVAAGEYSFRVNLSQKTYASRQIFNVRMTLENWTKEPLFLLFGSGQSFDFAIRDRRGNTVYTWSADKLFPAVVREESVTGEKNWTATEELDLRPGEYVLEAWLTTAGRPAYKAQLPVVITDTEPAK